MPTRLPKPRYRGYGWLPDLPDRRDLLFAAAPGIRRVPPRVDLRAGCSAVEDQGELGSCTANALAGALEFLERRDGVTFEDRSRLFIYYNERVVMHTTGVDSGAMLRDGIKTLVKQGACAEALWPYDARKFSKRPAVPCYRDGLDHRITSYRRITGLARMKTCLAEGFPFVFGFTVYRSFESAGVARTGVVPMPGRREAALGGHAVMAVGYDERAGRFTVRNSWGARWGSGGYCTMPYEYLGNPDMAGDFWTVRAGGGM